MTEENRLEVTEKTKMQVLDMLKQTIRPEFLNRIDETIMFTPPDGPCRPSEQVYPLTGG